MADARIQIDAQIQLRRDLDANWLAVDPVLRDGELAYSKDIMRAKVGDGASKWSELPYLPIDSGGGGGDLENYYTKAQIDALLKTLSDLLDSMWQIDDEGNVKTDRNVVSTKEISAGGAGEEGEEGGDEYRMYHHTQTTPSKTWTITHNLGKMPNVKIVDSLKQLCFGDIYYTDTNTVTIEFGAEESGDAYLD